MDFARLDKTRTIDSGQYPFFTLTYFKEGKPVLVSKVVVGKSMNKTAVFSGQMNQIVFSPYWNVPQVF
jgi:murein L,D-transpeptidase YcbB/YkuD